MGLSRRFLRQRATLAPASSVVVPRAASCSTRGGVCRVIFMTNCILSRQTVCLWMQCGSQLFVSHGTLFILQHFPPRGRLAAGLFFGVAETYFEVVDETPC